MNAARRLEVLPVVGIGEIKPATDLAEVIAAAAPWLRGGDVVVVKSKIVSKAEGQLVPVPRSGPEREAVRQAWIEAQTARTVAARGTTRIVATHHGFVLASAGVDTSNVDRGWLALLPPDPDASARGIRRGLLDRLGVDVAVIVSDTMGRPWRNGLTDVALGVAGMAPIRDYCGGRDPYGNDLQVTQMAVADELAGAAELVQGKLDRVPVAVIRGFLPAPDPSQPEADGPGGTALVRPAELDLFSLGTAEARAAGLADAAALGDAPSLRPVDPGPVKEVITRTPLARTTVVSIESGSAITLATADRSDSALIALGVDVQRLRAAFAAAGLATVWEPETRTLLLGEPAG